MIDNKPYKYLVNLLFIIFCFSTTSSYSQLLDSITIDTTRTYSLQQALKKDPLEVYKLNIKKLKLKEIPEEVYTFKNLNVLDVSKNKLSKFPKRIKELKYLQDLNISGNKIDTITEEIGFLVHLKKFKANQNQIISIPSQIQLCEKLEYIDLWGNDIGELPPEIERLKNTLKELDMRVILMSDREHQKIKSMLPNTKIRFSKSCNCGF